MTTGKTLTGALRVDPRRRLSTLIAWIAFTVVLTLSLVGYVVFKQHQAEAALAAYWSLDRTPCPVAGVQRLRNGRPPMVATFDGVTFERRAGFIQCVHQSYDLGDGRKDYPVCQFNRPQAVGVTVGRSTTIFAQPKGQSLRIAIADGKPVCVLIDRLGIK